jgi:hypothetical protein
VISHMMSAHRPGLRNVYYASLAMSMVVFAHVVAIFAMSEPLSVHLGPHMELGSNAFVLGFYWVDDRPAQIDWNVLGSKFRIDRTADSFFLQVPVPVVLLFLLIVTAAIGLSYRRNRRVGGRSKRRTRGTESL